MEIKREAKTKAPQIAVIFSGGKQYKVSPGEELWVEKLPLKEGKKVEFEDLLSKEKVSAEILKHEKQKKVRILKFKPKTRYKRTGGHRQVKTRIKILKIS